MFFLKMDIYYDVLGCLIILWFELLTLLARMLTVGPVLVLLLIIFYVPLIKAECGPKPCVSGFIEADTIFLSLSNGSEAWGTV